MSGIHLGSQVVSRKNTVSSSLDNEEVVLDATRGRYFGLNEVASLVWTRIQNPAKVSELVEAVMAEYDVDRAQCERDVVTLLESLAGKGLIEVQDGSPT